MRVHALSVGFQQVHSEAPVGSLWTHGTTSIITIPQRSVWDADVARLFILPDTHVLYGTVWRPTWTSDIRPSFVAQFIGHADGLRHASGTSGP